MRVDPIKKILIAIATERQALSAMPRSADVRRRLVTLKHAEMMISTGRAKAWDPLWIELGLTFPGARS
jgi:hypothetical protein